jgi:hypothetical protein
MAALREAEAERSVQGRTGAAGERTIRVACLEAIQVGYVLLTNPPGRMGWSWGCAPCACRACGRSPCTRQPGQLVSGRFLWDLGGGMRVDTVGESVGGGARTHAASGREGIPWL